MTTDYCTQPTMPARLYSTDAERVQLLDDVVSYLNDYAGLTYHTNVQDACVLVGDYDWGYRWVTLHDNGGELTASFVNSSRNVNVAYRVSPEFAEHVTPEAIATRLVNALRAEG